MCFNFIGVEDFGQVLDFDQCAAIGCHNTSCVTSCRWSVVASQSAAQRPRVPSPRLLSLAPSVTALVQPDMIHIVIARHVREDHGITSLQPFEYLNVLYRGAPHLH